MDSYEMIYMNQKALNIYGYHEISEIVGRKCYEVLQGARTPCAICSNNEIKQGYFKEWRCFNPILHKPFNLKDTMVIEDGRRCRIEIAVDESLQERQSGMIHSYQNMEALANEGLRLALNASTPDMAIDILLEYLGKALKGERTYIFEQNKEGNDDNTYEWTANGIMPERDNLQNVSAEVCENWYRHFHVNESITIKDIEDIRKEDPLQYENLKQQNIHSLVVVPLYDDNKVIGFYGVDNPPVDFLSYASDMLQIAGHFIISTLRRRNLLSQLRHMSRFDQLTQLGNRYAMKEYLEGVHCGKSLCAVYCDITGLKQVNDTQGHEAGDRLILCACDSLRSAFDSDGLFRIGGDEMIALCEGITEKQLQEKIQKLQEALKENGVNMAVGAAWSEDDGASFESLLREAERRMYEDKAAFYKKAGMDRRKCREQI